MAGHPTGRTGGARPSAPAAPRRQVPVLDTTQPDDIQGAFGTIRQHQEGGRSFRARLMALLAIVGPGLIVMVGDNDAGGVSTYIQAGQNYGTSLLWVLLLLVPVLIVNQEMVVRLGAVTGVGHARLIVERFGRGWGVFEASFLFLMNFLIIVTEFIGVSLALSYLGVSHYVSVPLAAAALVMVTASGSFRLWERSMFLFVFANLLVFPLLIMSHPHWGSVGRHFFVPGIRGGASSAAVLLIIAIVGTTVAPWQLFFQQSNIVDKRITPRWVNYERVDTFIGAGVVVIAAGALMGVTAFAFSGTRYFGHFVDAGAVAHALDHTLGSVGAAFFAVILLNASLIGAGAVTLATSYVIGDVTGARGSLHRSFREEPRFYAWFSALILVAAGIVLIPRAPLGVITEAVQALCGIVLPMTTVFLLMLCNDREVLGPWTNPPWLKAFASLVVGVLIVLSLILTINTLAPSVDVTSLAIGGGIALAVVLTAMGVFALRHPAPPPVRSRARLDVPKAQWTMPPATLLSRPTWSRSRRVAMWALGSYMVIALVLLIVKTVQLGGG